MRRLTKTWKGTRIILWAKRFGTISKVSHKRSPWTWQLKWAALVMPNCTTSWELLCYGILWSGRHCKTLIKLWIECNQQIFGYQAISVHKRNCNTIFPCHLQVHNTRRLGICIRTCCVGGWCVHHDDCAGTNCKEKLSFKHRNNP